MTVSRNPTSMFNRVVKAAAAIGSPAALQDVAFRAGATHREAVRYLKMAGWKRSAKAQGAIGMSSLWVESE